MLNRHQYWIALFMIFHASAGEWVSKPSDMRLCSGEDAELRWDYEEDDAAPVEMIFWMHGKAGETMMVWYAENNSTKVYNGYKNRVERLPGTKAGIVLRNVSVSDTGEYNIEVGGPGWRDGIIMNIHQESNLIPTILVDNEETEPDEYLDKSSVKQVTITVNTGENLKADISISTQGKKILAACSTNSLCSAVITFSEFPEDNISVAIDVDYGVCKKQGVMLTINTGVDSTRAWTATDVVVPIIVILIIIIILVIVGVFVYRMKKRKSVPKYNDEEKGEEMVPMPRSDDHFAPEPGKDKDEPTSSAPLVGAEAQNKSFWDKVFGHFKFRKKELSTNVNTIDNSKTSPVRSNSQSSGFENISLNDAAGLEKKDDIPTEESLKDGKSTKDVRSKKDVTAPVQQTKTDTEMAKSRKHKAKMMAKNVNKTDAKYDTPTQAGGVSDEHPDESIMLEDKNADDKPAVGSSGSIRDQHTSISPADIKLPDDNSDTEYVDDKHSTFHHKKTNEIVTTSSFIP